MKKFRIKTAKKEIGLFYYMAAIFVGGWSLMFFLAPGFNAFYHYTNQGETDYLLSEIPEDNRPVLPQMTFFEFIIAALPSLIGLFSAGSLILLGIISLITDKIYYLWAFFVSVWNLIVWFVHIIIYNHFRSLPTMQQNVGSLIFAGLPSIMCIVLNILILYWVIKYSNNKDRVLCS